MASKPYVSRRDKLTQPNTKSPKFREPTCKVRGCKVKRGLNSDGFCKTHVKRVLDVRDLYADCKECSEEVKTGQSALTCDKCSIWYHIECVHITDEQYKVIMDANETDKNMFHWYCRFCRDRCIEAVAKIDLLEGQTRNLASNVDKLNDRVDQLEAKMSKTVVNNVRTELDERGDIERRKYNVMVFNLPETPQKPGKPNTWYTDELKKKDTDSFRTIISESLEIDTSDGHNKIKDVLRIGRRDQTTRPRPLKVVFSELSTKREVLEKSKLLIRGKNKHIFINPDLTPKQREHDKKLRQDLKDRRSNGETDIYIRKGKIVNGNIPNRQIVENTSSSHQNNTDDIEEMPELAPPRDSEESSESAEENDVNLNLDSDKELTFSDVSSDETVKDCHSSAADPVESDVNDDLEPNDVNQPEEPIELDTVNHKTDTVIVEPNRKATTEGSDQEEPQHKTTDTEIITAEPVNDHVPQKAVENDNQAHEKPGVVTRKAAQKSHKDTDSTQ